MDPDRPERPSANNVVLLAPYRAMRGRDAAAIRRWRVARLRLEPQRDRADHAGPQADRPR